MLGKIDKEKEIVKFMIKYYCTRNHDEEEICKPCIDLINYAHKKLHNYPFKEEKTSCVKCKIHCYKEEKRKEIRKIMSYVGPRMIYLMPIQYIKHLLKNIGRRNI